MRLAPCAFRVFCLLLFGFCLALGCLVPAFRLGSPALASYPLLYIAPWAWALFCLFIFCLYFGLVYFWALLAPPWPTGRRLPHSPHAPHAVHSPSFCMSLCILGEHAHTAHSVFFLPFCISLYFFSLSPGLGSQSAHRALPSRPSAISNSRSLPSPVSVPRAPSPVRSRSARTQSPSVPRGIVPPRPGGRAARYI